MIRRYDSELKEYERSSNKFRAFCLIVTVQHIHLLVFCSYINIYVHIYIYIEREREREREKCVSITNNRHKKKHNSK